MREIAMGTMGGMMLTGIKRGLFSNEAGMGSAPNAAATADVSLSLIHILFLKVLL